MTSLAPTAVFEPLDPLPAAEAGKPAAPDAVPRWAALAVMRQTSSAPGMSLYDVVDADVRASGDVVLQSWWEGGSEMRRDSAALAALAARRGLSPAAVDAMFAAAGALAASGL